MKKITSLAIAGIAIVGGVMGCSGTNHDAPNPPEDIVIQWHRVETPPSFVTLMFGCFGTDGLLMDQGDGNTAVTPNDPMCPKGGASYEWVTRSGVNRPVINSVTRGPVKQ